MARIRSLIALTIVAMLVGLTSAGFAQPTDSARLVPLNKKKLTILSTSAAVIYTGTMVALNEVWYSDFDRSSFHFFNDAAEWKQMDKLGHFYSAFHTSSIAQHALVSCGVKKHNANLISSAIGFTVLSSIELFDGRSAAYGASVSDLAANFSGAMLFWAQQTAWSEIRIRPKFSFHTTSFAPQRPDVLGTGGGQIIKDYNGQTQWLSWNPGSFSKQSRWPAWLDISVGYGAEGMISARDEQNRSLGLNPHRQYYLSVDFNPNGVNVRSRLLKGILLLTKVIKVPAPTLEVTKDGVRFRPIYF